jgi:hypothetical protein
VGGTTRSTQSDTPRVKSSFDDDFHVIVATKVAASVGKRLTCFVIDFGNSEAAVAHLVAANEKALWWRCQGPSKKRIENVSGTLLETLAPAALIFPIYSAPLAALVVTL